MRKLPFIIVFLISISVYAQSPHGESFNKPCADCHTTSSWSINKDSLNFDHSATGFDLIGNHKNANCADCHDNLVFEKTPANCFNCHTDMHEGTVGKECADCHTPQGWIVTDITQIHERSRFPLIGAHNNDDCQKCHKSVSNLTFEPLGIECYDCHAQDYAATSSPNHATAGFSTDCVECHNLTSTEWAGGDFRHEFFPLTGGHNLGNCFDCHQTSTFTGLSPECINCHQPDYNSVVQPSHVNLGFSTNCLECHTTNPGWRPAEFTQHDQIFPLTGAHNVIRNDCASCHSGGFDNTPNTCVGCHQSDYIATTNPSHTSAGFSTDCESCHSTSGWIPASFDHDAEFFPIYSGKHRGEWDNCSDCHTDPNNFGTFECITCHEHNKSSMDSEHGGINGYQYNSLACFGCHPTGNDEGGFNHSTTNFPLTGSHTSASCSDCHTAGYSGTSMECVSCHQNDYNGVTNPNHSSAGFSTECSDCHNTTGWKPATYDHDAQFFPIYSGKHNGEWNVCTDCHTDPNNFGVFECITCHEHNQQDMNNEHRNVSGYVYQSNECLACHPAGDGDGAFNHTTSGFPLTGWHLTTDCASCHISGYTQLATDCETCHAQQYAEAPSHQAQGYPLACEGCHDTALWTVISYDHNQTTFALTGAHTGATCQNCHTSGLAGTSSTCVDCHIGDFQNSINPNHTTLNLDQNCESCHTTLSGWAPATFQVHDQFYLLTGAHTSISNDCASCHNGDYSNTSQECITCHQNDYDITSNPPHAGAGFNTVCEDCHSTTAWQPSTFDHDLQYFPVYSGKHNNEWNLCSDCHTDAQNYSVFECTTCHEHNQQEMDQEHNDVQGYVYLSVECLACHPDGSEDGAFNHITSNFPLTGNHSTASCEDCHASGFQNTPTTCNECHTEAYNTALNPNHAEAGIGNNCDECHDANGWTPSTFQHQTTGFELSGSHTDIQCSSCHVGTTTGLTNDCYSCHTDDFTAAVNPNHVAAGLSQNCQDCHTSVNWNQSTFEHTSTGFELLGSHSGIQCSSCHAGTTTGLTENCFDCHTENFNNAINPNHIAAGISQNCQDCHSSTDWVPSTFEHVTTGFELTGAHISTQCSSCHEGTISGLTGECYNCHNNDYAAAPDHLAQNFPQDCTICHGTEAWQGATFNHNQTAFPLTGAHIATACDDCHTNGYTGTTSVCVDCHISAYQATNNPDHEVLSLSQNCADCHTTNIGWEPATFSVHNNYYQLIGAHASISNNCADCHNGNYNNTPDQCIGCHQSDYNSASNPNHLTAGFPVDCVLCHTQNAWEPSTFNHDNQYFPIYSGKHNGEWDLCADCHTNSGNFEVFSCITCHEHRQSKMDEEHNEVGGYVYNSQACYNCHPDGDDKINIKRLHPKIIE